MPTRDKPEGPKDLAEVERALSVLKGRHPEHERVRREAEAAQQKRAVEQGAAHAKAARADNSRRLVLVGAGVAGAILLAVAFLAIQKESRRRANITDSAAPFVARGFTVVATTPRASPGVLEADAPAGCLLAVEAPGLRAHETGTLTVTVGDTAITGAGPVLTCTCAPTRVRATSDTVHGGLTLLRADVATIGGAKAFAHLPFAVGTKGATDAACQDASLDAWLAKHAPTTAIDPRWLDDAARAPLRAVGFETIANATKDAPFAIVEEREETCLVAVGDAVRLRLRGTADVLAEGKGAVAVCAAKLPALVVTGEAVVVAAPAAKVGGHVGLREVAEASGLTLGPVHVAPADLAWSAKALLVASGVPEALITTSSTPDIEKQPDARVVALSFAEPGALVADTAQGVFSSCAPALDDAADATCVFSGPHVWRLSSKSSVAGIARAKRPFWLFAMEESRDPGTLKAEVDMIAFTRRMVRRGFEPTTLEALTETATGADVLGRTNEDALVAVSLARSAPYVFPLTDGPAWTLDGEPRVLTVKPLEKVTLRALRPLPSAQEHRRTIVYRHRRRGT